MYGTPHLSLFSSSLSSHLDNIFTTYHSYHVLCRTMLRFPGINIYSFKAHATDLPKKDLFGKSGIHPLIPSSPSPLIPLIPSSPHPLIPSSPHPLIPSSPHPLIPSSLHPLTPHQVIFLIIMNRSLLGVLATIRWYLYAIDSFFSFTSFSFVFLSPSLLFSLSSFCFPLFSLLSSCFFDTCKCKERKS